jgi:outer membrane protein OmpA-like peptidoglycan-associated protein
VGHIIGGYVRFNAAIKQALQHNIAGGYTFYSSNSISMSVTRTLTTLCLCFCIPALYAQEKPADKGIFSFGVSMSDYNFQNHSKYATASKPSFGVQVTYWKPLVRHIDFSGNLGIVLSNLPAGFVKSDSVGQAGVTLHSDALIHLKAFRDARVNPFITAGIGWGSFGYQEAFYAPVGAGVAFHFNSGGIIILQGQMRESLSRDYTRNFMFYSASFGHNIQGTRPKKHKSDKDEVVKDALSSAAKGLSPDSDGDGTPDKDDKCPQIKGSKGNKGCPFPPIDGADILAMSPDSVTYTIYFDYDRSELVGYDFGVLNAIMQILKADKTLTVHISGYADMQGTQARNLQISAERANVTRDYFLSYSVSASRIISSYYGSNNPIDNVNQWRNRRAEVTLIRHW